MHERSIGSTLTLGVALALVLSMAGPATAGQLIVYRGATSEGEVVTARILRRESGRRLLQKIAFQRLEVTCEVGPGDEFGIAWIFGTPAPRLDDDGSLTIDERHDLVTGRFRWARGDGTLEIAYEQDGGTCTTGPLAWSVRRVRSSPA